MTKLFIDGREAEIARGATILDAARGLGIEIPTLCHLQGYPHFTSCMVCLVKESTSGRMLPACSALAEEGMSVETASDEVRESRRVSLELLLGEHVGDCEAPCQRACPAGMNIPRMIREIGAGRMREAIVTVKRDIALPAVLGRICRAPCEKACRRADRDGPVSICLLKRYAADVDLAAGASWLPSSAPASGRRVAIVGAGPAGLAAAYYLLQSGHRCEILDERAAPGGMLRYGVPPEKLEAGVLEAEIGVIARLGAVFRPGLHVGKDVALTDLRRDFDAVVLTPGPVGAEGAAALGLAATPHGIQADPHTRQTPEPGVFAGGSAVHPTQMAVRAVADGKAIACSVHQYLSGGEVVGPHRRFHTLIGRLHEGEISEYLKEADAACTRISPAGGPQAGFSEAEAVRECTRCLHCDCRKPESCRLRHYADQYHADRSRYAGTQRQRVERTLHHAVLYEPGKCIKCGICVRITERFGEKLGLTFIGRGFTVRVGVPFHESLARGLETTAELCADACPTGALARRSKVEDTASGGSPCA